MWREWTLFSHCIKSYADMRRLVWPWWRYVLCRVSICREHTYNNYSTPDPRCSPGSDWHTLSVWVALEIRNAPMAVAFLQIQTVSVGSILKAMVSGKVTESKRLLLRTSSWHLHWNLTRELTDNSKSSTPAGIRRDRGGGHTDLFTRSSREAGRRPSWKAFHSSPFRHPWPGFDFHKCTNLHPSVDGAALKCQSQIGRPFA